MTRYSQQIHCRMKITIIIDLQDPESSTLQPVKPQNSNSTLTSPADKNSRGHKQLNSVTQSDDYLSMRISQYMPWAAKH
ncbi:hypothetical protein VNO77_12793 [Canavalia gladiata]|uniref:Uncharacterized protein n=1 Tax=Canavalia gladiata TaxID=3824 RepID=A0AAN9QQ69_CANGL